MANFLFPNDGDVSLINNLWFHKLVLTRTCSHALTSSCTTIGYWKMEKICPPPLLPEDTHPCGNNPLLTTPGGGSELICVHLPLMLRKSTLQLKSCFHETSANVFLEAKAISGQQSLLYKNLKYWPLRNPLRILACFSVLSKWSIIQSSGLWIMVSYLQPCWLAIRILVWN